MLQFPTDRRSPASPEDADLLVCACGSTWFELCTVDPDGTKHHGAVVLNDAGRVTGYTGTPHCLSCGRENIP